MLVEPRLLKLQRRFMAALREPIFADSRARSELPPRDGAVSSTFIQTAEELISPSATMEPVERLELYHRQYWYRLLDSIAEDFPALRSLLGEESFWRLMEAYLEAVPPQSYTLRHLGALLPDFIAAHLSLVPYPVHAEDLARLEYALCAVFEAGTNPPIRAADLATTQVALQPYVQILELRTSADVIWRRTEQKRPPGAWRTATATPSRYVVVYREALDLRVERLPRAAYFLLAALDRSHSLPTAMEQVTATKGLLRPRDAPRVSEWFKRWISRGWFCPAAAIPDHPPTERNRS